MTTKAGLARYAAINALEDLRKDPRRTRTQKQRIYERICAEVKLNEIELEEGVPRTVSAIPEARPV